jgi:urease accessory protein UreF
MRTEGVIEYVNRDWKAIERMKRQVRAEIRSHMTASEALRRGDELRRHAHALHPEWPTEEQRRRDLLTHIRVSEALRSVPSRSGR